jgi:hypothetical protein
VGIGDPIHAAKQAAAAAVGTNPHYVTDAKKIVEEAPELKERYSPTNGGHGNNLIIWRGERILWA